MGYLREKWIEDILEAAGGEEIEAIVLHLFDMKEAHRQGVDFGTLDLETWRDQYYDIRWKLLDWETALPFMKANGCFYAWTKTKVLFVGYNEAYDQFWVGSAPRNPVAGEPHHADH